MAIDLAAERPIRLTSARNDPRLHRDGQRPDASQLYRWAGKGLLRDGRRVVLESVVVAGSRCTSAEAIGRFLADLNRTAGPEGPVYRSPTRREREILEAERELEAAA